MRENWEIKTLAEVCSSINGLWKGKKEPFVKVGVIRNANFTKQFTLDFSNIEYLEVEERQYKTRKLFKGDLIIEKSGGSDKWPVGRPVLFEKEEGEFSFSNFTSVLRIKNFEILSPKYLHYYLVFGYFRGDTRKLQSNTTGLHNLDFKTYLSIPLPVPPLSEQTAIVEKLDLEFAKIDLLKNNAQKQLDEAKALFQSTLKQLLQPKEGWEEKRLEEVCSIVSTLVNPTDKEYRKMLHVGGANIVSEKGVLVDLKSAEDENLVSGKFYFKNNVVLYNKIRPYLKKAARPNFNGLCSADMYPLTPNELISRDFLYYILISDDFTNYAIKNSARAGMPKINRNSLFAYSFKMPKSIQCQIDIGAKLDAISSKIKKLEENYKNILTHCDDLKQAILREIFG